MPPFHSRSTGACRIAFISSAGVTDETSSSMPSALRIGSLRLIDFRERGNTPPPSEIRSLS